MTPPRQTTAAWRERRESGRVDRISQAVLERTKLRPKRTLNGHSLGVEQRMLLRLRRKARPLRQSGAVWIAALGEIDPIGLQRLPRRKSRIAECIGDFRGVRGFRA